MSKASSPFNLRELSQLMLTATQLQWSSKSQKATSDPTELEEYTEYSASQGCYRGFCKVCGSTILWRSEETKGEVELMLGSVDEEYLFKGEGGQEIGKVLSQAVNGHFWCANALKGVTDVVRDGKLFEGSSDSKVVTD